MAKKAKTTRKAAKRPISGFELSKNAAKPKGKKAAKRKGKKVKRPVAGFEL